MMKNIIVFIIMTLSFLLALIACVQPNGRLLDSNTDNSTLDNPPPNQPTFSDHVNYFQEGSTKTSTSLILHSNFENFFYLRGKEINNYIINGNKTVIQCMAIYFPSSLDNKLLVLALTPKTINNLSTNTQEYYYHITSVDESYNQTHCQSAGILNQLDINFSGATISHTLTKLCPTCSTEQYLYSEKLELMAISGSIINTIDTSYLGMTIIEQPAISDYNENASCQTTAECISRAYDCCSYGQCVNDGTLKTGVDPTNSDYLQSLADIAINSNAFKNYPNIYHICGIEANPTPIPTPTISAVVSEQARFAQLQETYQCTTLIDGEMSLCTKTFASLGSIISGTYSTWADDRSFSTIYTGTSCTALTGSSIYKIEFASKILYENKTIKEAGALSLLGNNDNLADTTKVIFNNYSKPASANNSDLKITYMIDGSCKKTSSSTAVCQKYYTQGQNSGKVNDHYPVSNNFKLPYYADTSRNIKVTVDDVTKELGMHWNLASSGGSQIVAFTGPELKVYENQKVIITFYVDLLTYPNLMLSKDVASATLQQMCSCGASGCWLTPSFNSTNTITNYVCAYPDTIINTPVNTTLYVSAKTAPHLFFDQTGVYQKTITSTSVQEGNKFAYVGNDLLRPNNDGTYIGINEVYGSISTNLNGARPAVEVAVNRNTSYDIYVNSGTYSTCYYCGSDYYSQLAKLFPSNFSMGGGGYDPDGTTSSKSKATTYRGDDLLFGRACFVPVTMIPWTHQGITSSNAQTQREHRLQAQHFLFANGYQRDWFGFDYGSVIGSFDGVKWFSIGNQRRIKATSNKLFIAINGYFSDLANNTDFKVQVIDAILSPLNSSTISSDFKSDGATCQQYHLCDSDSDCVTQLGWEYTCQNISSIQSKWPVFDNNGMEIPGGEQIVNLLGMVGNGAGSGKRCVYRGRGTPCHGDYSIDDSTQTFDGSDLVGMHGCSSNNYCQQFYDSTEKKFFNNKISRWGKSVSTKNATNNTSENSFGMGAKIIGRPFEYGGTQEVDSDVMAQFSSNNFDSICIPGRYPGSWGLSLIQQHSYRPSSMYLGDQVSNIGMTLTGNNIYNEYLSSCPILDSEGNYYHLQRENLSSTLATPELVALAGTQSLSTNSLRIFESMLNGSVNLVSDFVSEQIITPTLQEDRCLRAPGSPCFSDMECGPSDFIANKLAGVVADDSSYINILNKYEINFWKEGLICGQSDSSEHTFSLKENRCCRETTKVLTIPTYQSDTNLFERENVPGVDTKLSSVKRYSGNSVNYNDIVNGTLPVLEAAANDKCSSGSCMSIDTIQNQYATFAAMADKMCCSGHWVRNFNDNNGGGHKWHHSKAQTIQVESFQCLNWQVCSTPATCIGDFSCDHATNGDDGDCLLIVTDNTSAEEMFGWLNRLELAGVPQIPLRKTTYLTGLAGIDDPIMCKVNPADQTALPAANTYIANTVLSSRSAEYIDYSTNPDQEYYSAADQNNFNSNIKMIFSPDKITCCIPAGETLKDGESADRCCTGFKTAENRCALDDYTNVSVYFNRYISSATKGLSDILFDSETGYFNTSIQSPNSSLIRLACLKHVCASDKMAQGLSLSTLKVPGLAEGVPSAKKKRYLDGHDDASNNYNGFSDLYDIGLRWNTDLYCVPAGLTADPDNNLKLIDCGGGS